MRCSSAALFFYIFLISLESFNNFYVAVRWTVAYNK